MAYFTGNVAYKNTVSSDIDAKWNPMYVSSEYLKTGSVDMLTLSSFSIISINIEVKTNVDISAIVIDLTCNSLRNMVGTIAIERITSTVENMLNIGIIEYSDSKLKITNPGLFVSGCNYIIRGQLIV